MHAAFQQEKIIFWFKAKSALSIVEPQLYSEGNVLHLYGLRLRH